MPQNNATAYNRFFALDYVIWLSQLSYSGTAVAFGLVLPELQLMLSISDAQGGGIESARVIGICCAFLVTGVYGAMIGKKNLLWAGHLCLAISLLAIPFIHAFAGMVLIACCMGLSSGIVTASSYPLMIDLHHQDSKKFTAIMSAFYPFGIACFSVIFGFFLTTYLSWQWGFFILSAMNAAMCGLLLVQTFPQYLEVGQGGLIQALKGLYKQKNFWFYVSSIFLAGGIEANFLFWIPSFLYRVFNASDTQRAIALISFAITMALGRALGGYIQRYIRLEQYRYALLILGLVCSLGFIVAPNMIIAFVMVFLCGLSVSAQWPLILVDAAQHLAVKTFLLLSLLGLCGFAGLAAYPSITGIMSTFFSLQYALLIIPISYGLLLILPALFKNAP